MIHIHTVNIFCPVIESEQIEIVYIINSLKRTTAHSQFDITGDCPAGDGRIEAWIERGGEITGMHYIDVDF
ncbi:hypothetical protein ACFL60_01010 [Candidatus Omnitrophota bacterium]